MKLFPGGLCEKCFYHKELADRKRQREEKADASLFAHQITQLFADLTADIQADTDPIKALEILPEIQRRHEITKMLLALLEEYEQHPGLDAFLKENRSQPQFDYFKAESFINSYKKQSEQHDRAWDKIASELKTDAQFHKKLITLPRYNFVISNNTICDPVICEFKTNNITIRSNFDKLGNFVVLDVETTGLCTICDHIIEVAAIRFESWEPAQVFESLINPGKPLGDNISDLTGITDDMVRDAPKFPQIIDSLDVFIGDSNIVGHNLSFDLGFLNHEGWQHDQKSRKYYDTLSLARGLLKKPSSHDSYSHYDVENHKLTTLCSYFQIRSEHLAHRASSDCLATGYLFRKLVSKKILGV